ncbi:hypothetical protein Moror_11683 [Moniliophthora roreri MCA 2997]|uniref:Uncharacterized protein n=1 Tax=Moniliophthora roreri (strain MCA 2997) TaxID=1381753 RepID=V2X3M0_MONRO|nr:hypothetical protein Moror_11683 [Moniliophthora roreri MCA 2997]
MTAFPSLVQLANWERIEHARESLPVKKRKRLKAVKLPSLLGHLLVPRVEDCLRQAERGEVVVTLDVLVLPPQPSTKDHKTFKLLQHLYCYTAHKASFCSVLQKLHLTFTFPNLRVATTVGELLQHLTARIQAQGYSFPERSALPFAAPHESLPLGLLSYTNMGRLSGSNKTPRLMPSNVPASSTIDELLRNNRDFAIPKWAVSSRNTFELHAIIQAPFLEVYASLSTLGLGNDMVDCVHWCISRRIYGVFQNDIDTVDSEGWESIVNDPALEQGCDHAEGSQLEEEEDEERVVAQSLTAFDPQDSSQVWTHSRSRNELNTSCSTSASSAASTLGSADSSDSTASDSNSTVSPRSATPSISSSNSSQSQEGALAAPEPNQRAQIGYVSDFRSCFTLVVILKPYCWEHEKPTAPTDISSFYDFECPVYFFDTISTDYISAHGKHLQGLELKGESTWDLAKQLEAILIEAVQAKDFSKVFASTCHFMLVDQAEEYITLGGGIEREVIFILNQLYLKERAAEFLTKGLDDYATLATVPQYTARFMSEDKRIALSVLGAVVSLSLIYGMGVEPLNPILLMYCYNDCDMRSVLDELVREWQTHEKGLTPSIVAQ